MITAFPNKAWSKTSLNRLYKKIVRIVWNVWCASELICSQEDIAQSHKSPWEIERETGISRRTVQLQTYKRVIGHKRKLKRLQ